MAPSSSSRPTGGQQGSSSAKASDATSASRTGKKDGARGSADERSSSSSELSTSRTARGGFATFTSDRSDDRAVETSSSRTPAKGANGKGTSSSSASGSDKGAAARKPGRGPRRIRLTLARLDPFSVMKISFLVALCLGIATVVCTAILWGVVDGIGLWDKLDSLGRDLNNNKPLPFMQFFQFSKVLAYSVVIAFVNLVIITALGTLFAFLYNIVASLLGGLKMTFTDE